MGRKLNKLEMLIFNIKEFFNKKNIIEEVLTKSSISGKYWQDAYYNLLEDYCTVMYDVTDGILSYKHYKPEDILELDNERINRIIYQDRVEQLKEIMNEVKDYPTVLDVMIALDEYRVEAEGSYEIYKR